MDHCTGGEGAYTVDYVTYLEEWVEHGRPPQQLFSAHVSDAYLAAQMIPSSIESELPVDTPQEVRNVIAAELLPLPLDPDIPLKFTRPVYPYPLHAQYKNGDPNRASSFGPK
jgi:hypothetical protein